MFTLFLLAVAAQQTHMVELNGHRFTLPAGFSIEKLPTPAALKFPVAAAFDDAGNLYVTEASGTNAPPSQQAKELPHRLWKLPAGRFADGQVFADKLMLPQGVMCMDGAVYVGAPPTITRFADGKRETWHDGQTLTGCANDLHGPYPGPDGWIYWTKGAFAEQSFTLPTGKPFKTKAAHIYRARPDGTGREPVFTAGMDNPVDVVFTPGGERFVAGTFLQHPADGKRDGLIHAVYGGVWGKDHGPVTGHPWTAPTLMPPMTHLGPAAPSGLHRYDAATFGPEFTDNLFCTQFNLRKVSRHVLVPDGATFRTTDSDFLVSDQLDFHPTDVTEDHDGSLLVIDTGGWYKLCCPTSQLVKPDVPGAIYRVRKTGATPTPRTANPKLDAVWAASRDESKSPGSGLPTARAALTDADETARQAAIHVVGLYRDKQAVPALVKLLATGTPHNKRAVAEALGRIGDSAAVAPLLEAHIGVTDRVLQHSLTYALIEIGDPQAIGKALGLGGPSDERATAALMALEQMPNTGMTAAAVGRWLRADNPGLRAAAWWVAGRHPEWGTDLAPELATALRKPTDETVDRLARFAGDSAVQAVLAEAIRGTPDERATALAVLSRSALKSWPPALWAAVASTPVDIHVRSALKTITPSAEQLTAVLDRVPAEDRVALLATRPRSMPLTDTDFARVAAALSRVDYNPQLAVEALARGVLTTEQLQAVAATLPTVAVTDKNRLLDLFASAPEPAALKLLAVIAADTGLQGSVRPELVRQLIEKAPPAVKEAATPVLAKLEAGLADQRQKLESLLTEMPKGDVRRGQQVFNGPKAVCITCHQMGYVGGKTGPDLTRIGGIRSERDLLEAIVYPSASFVRSYEPVTATTLDGRTVNGVLRRDDAAGLVIAVSATEEVRIPRAELESARPGTVSLMPAGFDQQLTKQELADLVAFLKASR